MTEPSYFLAFDGDLVGRVIEKLVIAGELETLRIFSGNVTRALEIITALIVSAHGKIYLQGGDNILAETQSYRGILARFRDLKEDFPVSFSIGIGHTPMLAYVALKYAKACGSGLSVLAKEQEGSVLFTIADS